MKARNLLLIIVLILAAFAVPVLGQDELPTDEPTAAPVEDVVIDGDLIDAIGDDVEAAQGDPLETAIVIGAFVLSGVVLIALTFFARSQNKTISELARSAPVMLGPTGGMFFDSGMNAGLDYVRGTPRKSDDVLFLQWASRLGYVLETDETGNEVLRRLQSPVTPQG